MRSLEKIISDNIGGYKPVKLPALKPWDREAAQRRLAERRRLNEGYTKGAH